MIAGGYRSYDIETLKHFFQNGFKETGFSRIGRKVLIKPNLLSGKPPENAVTTHPVFLRALSEFLKDNSCSIFLGDSPGYEPLERVLKASGYLEFIDHLDITIARFKNKIEKRIDGISPYRYFDFGEDPGEFDLVINVPKLKTHAMMGMTLGVKNTFGFIRGFEKGRLHLRAGKDRALFASILIDIHQIVSPAITILDGILGMCGDGPSSGIPVNTGIVALSKNAFALDDFIEKFLCGPYVPFPVISCAMDHGLLPDYVVIDKGLPPAVDFPVPRTSDTDWNLPPPIKRLLRNVFLKKPKILKDNCVQCGVCVEVCPAHAITKERGFPRFDHSSCIKCYCCQEMCPHGAIRT